jgi:nicotinic acid mononucleotide adenylyltransferase
MIASRCAALLLLVTMPAGAATRDLHTARRAVESDFAATAHRFKLRGDAQPLNAIQHSVRSSLDQITRDRTAGKTRSARVRNSRSDAAPPIQPREIRLLFFPLAADPPHWGHLGNALAAVARMKLDHVVVVPAGDDPRKPGLLPLDFRLPMLKYVVAPYGELFSVSDINRETNVRGEDNLFHLLHLNPKQRIHAYFLVGSDHYQLQNAAGNPDTLAAFSQNIAERLAGFDPTLHKVTALFFGREGKPLPKIEMSYPIEVMVQPFPAASSKIRPELEKLARGEPVDPAVLSLLPARVLEYIEQHGNPYAAKKAGK